jgi:hypothetical protein
MSAKPPAETQTFQIVFCNRAETQSKIDRATAASPSSAIMNKPLSLIIALVGFSLATLVAQTPSASTSPEASASPAKKHRHSKKDSSTLTASVTPTPASASATAEASPSPSKRKRAKKETTATPAASASPAAATTPAKRSFFHRSETPTPSSSPVAGTAPAPMSNSTSKAQTSRATELSGAPAPGGGPGMVWVNTESHVYHAQSSRWYGRTKKGKYMSEQDAIKEGDRPAKEEQKQKQ